MCLIHDTFILLHRFLPFSILPKKELSFRFLLESQFSEISARHLFFSTRFFLSVVEQTNKQTDSERFYGILNIIK